MSAAPETPKNSIGLRPKRSWNHTEIKSSTPTGMRPIPNLDLPACRGWSGTGRSASRNQRVGDATGGAVGGDPHPGVLAGELLQHRPGGVVAAVVHDHQLAGVRQRTERGVRLADQIGEILRLVPGGHEDAHVGERRRGGEAHSRLRIRAGRMLSWSRYLATVRRAMRTPRLADSSTICWSVRGVLGSSFATSF